LNLKRINKRFNYQNIINYNSLCKNKNKNKMLVLNKKKNRKKIYLIIFHEHEIFY
jgi:hypothetical protein